MQLLTLVLITLLPVASLARPHEDLSRQNRGSMLHNVARDTKYKLQTKYQGQSFFDNWDFFTGPDPTHGFVKYESRESAKDLAYVQGDGVAVLKVDNQGTVPAGGNRRSVRIATKEAYNGGLFIFDVAAFASGRSVWPALWTTGANWPNQGEIDIIEYVNEATMNQITLHTGSNANCKLNPNVLARYKNEDGSQPKSYLGGTLGLDCTSSGSNNAGCAVTDFEGSAGAPFNAGGGGVTAMLWDDTQISFWSFKRDQIPQDVQSGDPNPSTWGSPIAFWSNESCDIANAFRDHSIIINISICGDWAGAAFGGNCADAVANPSNYDSAQTKINSISVYQKA